MSEGRGRAGLFFALYLCEGAPIGFLWWALPTILREGGAPRDAIGNLLALLALPWALKFLWAPLVDMGGRLALGRWIGGAQSVMALSLALVLVLDPARQAGPLTAALVVHALAAASQDAAIDALAIRSVPLAQRGRVNAWMQIGMLTGRSLFGGGVLLARRWLADEVLIGLLVAGLLVSAGRFRRLAVRAGAEAPLPTPGFGRRLARAARRPTTWLALGFAATSGAGFEAVGLFAGPYLTDRGFESDAIGLYLGLAAVGAMATGAALGGRASDRLGTRRAVALAGLGLGAAVLALAALGAQLAAPALLALLTVVYLGIGAFTAASYALFMALSDPELGATQFSAYMGATNACESWSARLAGRLAEDRGYGPAFGIPAWIGLGALLLVPWLRPPSNAPRASVE